MRTLTRLMPPHDWAFSAYITRLLQALEIIFTMTCSHTQIARCSIRISTLRRIFTSALHSCFLPPDSLSLALVSGWQPCTIAFTNRQDTWRLLFKTTSEWLQDEDIHVAVAVSVWQQTLLGVGDTSPSEVSTCRSGQWTLCLCAALSPGTPCTSHPHPRS